MNDRNREQLFQEINEVSFAVNDILLYLDSNPCDKEALDYYRRHMMRRKELLNRYAAEYGPLTVDTAVDTAESCWKWINQPWPWESPCSKKGGWR